MMRTICPDLARRLTITRQRLAGPRPTADSVGMMEVKRDLGYLQIDPMRVVERSHLLVLWSRLGRYDPSHLDALLWKEKRLFQDWAQATSIVLTEDYPIFAALKRSFATGDKPWAKRIQAWLEKNKKARSDVLSQLRNGGPLPSDSFKVKFAEDWRSTGWTADRNISMMLTFLWAQGKIMIAHHVQSRKVWDLTERFLPEWVSKEELSDEELLSRVAQKPLRALGMGSTTQIEQHFIRRCCRDIKKVLARLEAKGLITQVKISDDKRLWPGNWYIHVEELPLLDRLTAGEWEPRTTLLSPFDNLICDRKRTEQLYNFHFRFEVYLPKAQRKYGCYVMPILHGDRLIGRIDPRMDRKKKKLMINAVYVEPDAPKSEETGQAVATAIGELAAFLGAEEIVYGERKPREWEKLLH
jgi:uncharacterized protein YcaQ